MLMEYNQHDHTGRYYVEITMPTGVTFRSYQDDPCRFHQIPQSDQEQSWIEPMYQQWDSGCMMHDYCPIRKITRTVHNGTHGRSHQVEEWPWHQLDYVGPPPDRRAYRAMGIESHWMGSTDFPVFKQDIS